MIEGLKPADRFAKIHNLLGSTKEFSHKALMNSLAKHLEGFAAGATFVIHFEGGANYVVKLANKQVMVEEGEAPNTDFQIYVEEGTAQRVASGVISPIYALGREKMRISGNTTLAIRVYEKLAADDGLTDPCRRR